MYENIKDYLLDHYKRSLKDAISYKADIERDLRELLNRPEYLENINMLKVSALQKDLVGVNKRIEFINSQIKSILNDDWEWLNGV